MFTVTVTFKPTEKVALQWKLLTQYWPNDHATNRRNKEQVLFEVFRLFDRQCESRLPSLLSPCLSVFFDLSEQTYAVRGRVNVVSLCLFSSKRLNTDAIEFQANSTHQWVKQTLSENPRN